MRHRLSASGLLFFALRDEVGGCCLCQTIEQMELALFTSQAAFEQIIGRVQDVLDVSTTGLEVKSAY